LTEAAAHPSQAILSLKEAKEWREYFAKNHKKLVVTNGCFDILHKGHVEYLLKARNAGDGLLVLVNSDSSVRQLKGPARPVNNEQDRAFLLASLKCIDAVMVFNGLRCTDMIKALKPDIYAKGGDYNIDTINSEEKAALLEAGTKIIFIPFVSGFSTTETISKLKQ